MSKPKWDLGSMKFKSRYIDHVAARAHLGSCERPKGRSSEILRKGKTYRRRKRGNDGYVLRFGVSKWSEIVIRQRPIVNVGKKRDCEK